MSVKINSLSEKEIRDIGDAFADFQYAESEFGKELWFNTVKT